MYESALALQRPYANLDSRKVGDKHSTRGNIKRAIEDLGTDSGPKIWGSNKNTEVQVKNCVYQNKRQRTGATNEAMVQSMSDGLSNSRGDAGLSYTR